MPDLIVLDIQIQHINGLEIINWLRQDLESDVKIIVITANDHGGKYARS